MRLYIPGKIANEDYFLVLPENELIPAAELEVDPFSRVVCPGLRNSWAEGRHLSRQEISSFQEAKFAYTRASRKQKA